MGMSYLTRLQYSPERPGSSMYFFMNADSSTVASRFLHIMQNVFTETSCERHSGEARHLSYSLARAPSLRSGSPNPLLFATDERQVAYSGFRCVEFTRCTLSVVQRVQTRYPDPYRLDDREHRHCCTSPHVTMDGC